MDKERIEDMLKKTGILLCAFFFFSILLSGCETTKGVAYGVGSVAEGAGKDAQGLWQGILKLDNWMKENLW